MGRGVVDRVEVGDGWWWCVVAGLSGMWMVMVAGMAGDDWWE